MYPKKNKSSAVRTRGRVHVRATRHRNWWAKVIARRDHKLKGAGGECKFAWSINHEVQRIEGRTSDYQPERT